MTTFGWQRVATCGRFAVAAAVLASAGLAGAMNLSVDSVDGLSEGQSARVCVRMDSGGQKIAGVQNDLSWDANCLSFGGCQANIAHGKTLSMPKSVSGNSTKAILLAFDNLDPIPDGELYCCSFTVRSASPGGCCPVNLIGALGSDPQGNPVRSGAHNGRLCMAGSSGMGGGLGGARPGAGPGVVSNVPPQGQAPGAATGGTTANNVTGGGAPPAPAGQVMAGGGGPAPGAPGMPVPPAPGASPPAAALPAAVPPAPAAPGAPAAGVAGAPQAPAAPAAPAAAGAMASPAPPAAAATKPAAPTQPAKVSSPTAKRGATPTEKVDGGGSGWGCQVGGGAAAGWPLFAVAAVLVAVRRRR